MSLTDRLVPTYRHMLQTLSGLIDKAGAQRPGAEAEILLAARLAPDMLPLSSQMRFAAYQAQEATFRLRGQPVPAWLEAIAREGWDVGESPGSIREARTRINQALSLLDALDPNALDDGIDRPIVVELPGGLVFDMIGESFVRDWALPQFYFHVVTAYAILRSQGIDIGKADYVPHMFGYLRADAPTRS